MIVLVQAIVNSNIPMISINNIKIELSSLKNKFIKCFKQAIITMLMLKLNLRK